MILSIYWKLLCLSAGAKNQLHPQCFSKDWLTVFWPVNWEPEFCQIWDWWWNINNNINFHLKFLINFSKNSKKIVWCQFGPLLLKFGQKWIFMEKRALPVFKWVLGKVQYFKRQWLTFSYILSGYLKIIITTECCLQYLPELAQQPDKKIKNGNENLQRVSWYLHQIKKTYINTVCTKLASKDSLNCFAIFGSSACQGRHVFSMSFLTCISPRSSDTNVEELI